MSRLQLEMPHWRSKPDFYIETKAHALSYFMGAELIQVTALGTGEITALVKVESAANNGDLKVITGVLQFYREMDDEAGESAQLSPKKKPRSSGGGAAST